jgi:hypothetical protein
MNGELGRLAGRRGLDWRLVNARTCLRRMYRMATSVRNHYAVAGVMNCAHALLRMVPATC